MPGVRYLIVRRQSGGHPKQRDAILARAGSRTRAADLLDEAVGAMRGSGWEAEKVSGGSRKDDPEVWKVTTPLGSYLFTYRKAVDGE